MTIDEKKNQAYWYSTLLCHMELAKLLSDKPKKAMRNTAKSIASRTDADNIKLIASKASKEFFPDVWLDKQHKAATKEMTLEKFLQMGFSCK